MTTEHLARAASQRSMAAVESGDRDAWLALFAPDALIEDPIGESALDSEGKGQRGLDAIAAFWDANIGPNTLRFDISQSFAAGPEVANVGTITTTLPDGSQAAVEGVFTYRVDEDGRLIALRAFWNFAENMTFRPPEG